MKFTKTHFKQSTRLKRYETKIKSILKSEISLDVKELYTKGEFKNKASLETLLHIAAYSKILSESNNTISLLSLKASVTYTISGNGITGVFLAGKSGNISGGTVHGVEMSSSYDFKISVVHSGGNWTFNTSKILVNDGAKRKLSTSKISNKSNDIINTTKA
ncbi:hypothetical protein [Ulvibacter antarcticus]|uniref:Uncharacterized protein n=1 Tax=Ulvibacter antarcticus TaxID=442714 RepID=A0A3L9YWY0_9FLAO|nr:hypothetical protein [Ulvibacter antarcticus]RMA64310.1 hypothetical protein BXY75_1183 [Ulvibacter antarcticus]